MTSLGWTIATWSVVAGGLVLYLLGVQIGKSFERRRLTLEFQALIVRLLHFAAKQDYVQLHALLQELVADREVLEEIKHEAQTVEEPQDILSRITRGRSDRVKPSSVPEKEED